MPHLKVVAEAQRRVELLAARLGPAELEAFQRDCPRVWLTYAPVFNVRWLRWWKRWMPEPEAARELEAFLDGWEREMCRRNLLG